MTKMLQLLNDQDPRVEICKNYTKNKIIEKMGELKMIADSFEHKYH